MRQQIRSRTPHQLGSPNRKEPLPHGARPGPGANEQERGVLVGILLPHSKADPRDPLGELKALAESAKVEVVDAMMQKRMAMQASTGLGKGKVEELVQRVIANNANVVVFDNDLAPRQIRELEKAVHCKVIDRSELILDIFASRAKTREAQLQVELAQLEYTAPRLRGMWTHLERIAGGGGGTSAGVAGGVGTRGPGERQIEIDRRIVRDRISHLKREIAEIDRRKRREVQTRKDEFTVSLVGYTNSGKTTLFNRLTHTNQFAADMLFATLDTKTTRWQLEDGPSVLLSDTVGFVRDLPHHLVASFRATLEETIHANFLLHVIDASSPYAWQQMESVEGVLEEIGCKDVAQIQVLNKMDIAEDSSLAEMLTVRGREAVRVSALLGDGIDELVRAVNEKAKGDSIHATLLIGHREGRILPQLQERADVLARRYVAEGVELDIRINREQLRQLLGRFPSIDVLDDERPPAEDRGDDR